MADATREVDYTATDPAPVASPVKSVDAPPFDSDQNREETRGDLARGLLWLLTLTVGGVMVFVGLGRLDGTVITQSVFPSLIALAGTALGFYFGSQQKGTDNPNPSKPTVLVAPPAGPPPPAANGANDLQQGDGGGH